MLLRFACFALYQNGVKHRVAVIGIPEHNAILPGAGDAAVLHARINTSRTRVLRRKPLVSRPVQSPLLDYNLDLFVVAASRYPA